MRQSRSRRSAPLPAAQRALRGLLAGAALAAGKGARQRPALHNQGHARLSWESFHYLGHAVEHLGTATSLRLPLKFPINT